MRQLVFALLFLSIAALPAQQPAPTTPVKGVAPLPTHHSSLIAHHSTRAVVIGISDYQSPQIPDLKFADKDAGAFVEWLRSPAGGNVPEENITLLTNKNATNSNIGAAFDGLAEESREGDLAIIYFSGHGDVETKTRNQFGFLLAWDSPPNNYKAGAYPLIFLQDIVSTISDKKVRVVVIADACHAGKLAGSTISGTQATAQTLAQQFANEVKIMSCQPNELALEGEQWGGGRGAFSFNLLEGLTGLADKNADAAVNLYEIDRYLGDVVPQQTAPHPQFPMVVGDRQFTLARVDAPSLAALKEKRAKNPGGLALTGGKGFVEGLLGEADSALLQLYRDFEAALENGNLLDGNPSADDLFVRLSKEEKLRPLHGLMRRNLAAALQNEPQQALNALLESDPYESNNWIYNPKKYADYPVQLARATELLGEKHYMHYPLLSKKRFFEAYLLARSLTDESTTKTIRDSICALAKTWYLEAAALEPSAAYIPYSIGNLHAWANPAQTDSLVKYMSQAIELSPSWILPYTDIAMEWWQSMNNLDEAGRWLTTALNVSPQSYLVQERLSWLRQIQNRTDESLEISKKMIAQKPDLFNAYATTGVTLQMRKEFLEAEKYFKKAIELDANPNGNWAMQFMPEALGKTRRLPEAVEWTEKFVNDSSVELRMKSNFIFHLIFVSWDSRRIDLIEEYAERLEKLGVIGPHLVAANLLKGQAKIYLGEDEAGLSLLKNLAQENPFDGALQMKVLENQAIVAARNRHSADMADSLFQKTIHYRKDLNWLDVRLGGILESARFHYGQFLLAQNRDTEALAQFKIGLEEEPLGYYPPYGMALFAARQGKTNEALDWLEKSLDRWYPIPGPILEEPLFKKLRKTKRFKTMMAKHFPEK